MEVAESGMFTVHQNVGTVLCCKCGIRMQPNAANMCVRCLCSEVDITEGLKKHMIIRHCPECDTHLHPPSTWIRAPLESKQLLALCIKLLHLPKAVRLVHAEFIWTEPHSKRIKLRLTIQKEVLSGAVLEQAFVSEFVQQETMCDSCVRFQANPDQWVACVQLRQHVPHRRTFYHLEQLILKHGASAHAIKIKQMDHGIDFFFGNRSRGEKFVQFVKKFAPVTSRDDKQEVSRDGHSNNYKNKYTFSVEIAPICAEDLIFLPRKYSLGNLGPIVICTKVANKISLLDPLTLGHQDLDADQYWDAPFKSLLTSGQLVKYIILNIESIPFKVNSKENNLAEVQVARVSDFGKNDRIFSVKTHLGRILKPGDEVLGYDLYGANINDIELEKMVLPEAVLIKKIYEERPRGRRMSREYEAFLRDLEENPDSMFDISLCGSKESTSDGESMSNMAIDEDDCMII